MLTSINTLLIAEHEIAKNTGVTLYLQQFKAMFIKRVIHTWRNRLVTITQLVVPIFFTFLACMSIKNISGQASAPASLTLSLSQFTEQRVAYVTNSTYNSANVSSLVDSLTSTVSGLAILDNVNNIEPYKSSSNPSLTTYLGDIGSRSADDYNRKYMVAADISGEDNTVTNSSVTLIGQFNNEAYHTIAIALGVVDNTLLKYWFGNSYSIEAINHPLPLSTDALAEEELTTSSIAAFVLSTNIMFGMLCILLLISS